MKTLVAVPMVVALLAGMMLTGGCVSQAKYDEALAAARRANDARDAALAALEQLKEKNRELMAQLDESKRALDAEAAKYALLKSAYDKLMADYKALADKGPIVIEKQGPIPEDLNAAIKEWARRNGLPYDAERGVVRFPNELLFEKGKDFVSEKGKAALKGFAELMARADAAEFCIYVAGHTDDIPIRPKTPTAEMHPNNWYLSVHRSIAVQQELTKSGLQDERIGAMGYGENHPIAPNAAGKKGNALNRRVELWIVPKAKFLVLPLGYTMPEPAGDTPKKPVNKKPVAEDSETDTPDAK